MNCYRCGNRAVWRLWDLVVWWSGGEDRLGDYCEECLDLVVEYAYAPWYATPIDAEEEGPFVGGWDIDDTEEG